MLSHLVGALQFDALVLDTVDLVCGKEWCPCIANDPQGPILMYWDRTHLTYEYAATLQPTLVTILTALGFFRGSDAASSWVPSSS